MFEYELPFNFVFEQDLTRTFSAIGMTNGEYIGLLFSSYEEKEDFNGKMLAIQSQLRLARSLFEEFKTEIVAK